MLGKLAKKLRLLGYDSIYSSNVEDKKLLNLAKKENRILITKDAPLVKKATKEQVATVQITKTDEIDQFLQINEQVRLSNCTISGNNSRCPLCNGELGHTEQKLVLDKVPDGILERVKDFWMCKSCKKIYWEGTHIKNLQKFARKLNDRL